MIKSGTRFSILLEILMPLNIPEHVVRLLFWFLIQRYHHIIALKMGVTGLPKSYISLFQEKDLRV